MNGSSLSCKLTNLSDGTEYQATAVVKNKAGDIFKGDEVTFSTVKWQEPTPQITGTSVNDITTSSASVSAKVRYYQYVTEAYVKLSKGDVFIGQYAASMNGNVLSTGLTNLSDNMEYQVTAVVKNKNGDEITGTAVTFSTLKKAGDFVTFEDSNFKLYCVSHFDTDQDGEISLNEAAAVTSIDCQSKSISSLKGLESFSNLIHLSCWNNSISSIDITPLADLTYLNCEVNKLTVLKLSDNTNLTTVACYGNQLTSLDVSNNTSLKHLDCHKNRITALDVSRNTALNYLSFWENQLSSLDISSNTALTFLNCEVNQLSSLNLTNQTSLTEARCSGNRFTSLDISHNANLSIFCCESNLLTSLDLSNNLKLNTVTCINNPSLTEIWLKEGQTIANFSYDSSTATIHYKP